MSLPLVSRRLLPVSRLPYRSLSTVPPTAPTAQVPPPPTSQQANGSEEPYTHFKITATRSAIGLGKRYKATFEALGIWKRMQTVYMKHSPEAAGKILRVKELVKVENVTTSQVRNKAQQRADRKAPRGYLVVDRMLG